MKKRKAETLVEVIIAFAAFGVLLGGVTDFMSTHLKFIAWTKQRDETMFNEQWLTARAQWLFEHDITTVLKDKNVEAGKTYPNIDFTIKGKEKDVKYVEENIVSFDWDHEKKLLVVKNNITSVDFLLIP